MNTHGSALKGRKPLSESSVPQRLTLSGSIISAALRETIGRDIPPYGLRTITHEGYNNMQGTPCWMQMPAKPALTQKLSFGGMQTFVVTFILLSFATVKFCMDKDCSTYKQYTLL
jgi:hypothetical protein